MLFRSQQSDVERKKFLEYKTKAEQGDAATQFVLGLYYYSGKGTEKDYVEAYAWFNLAAQSSNAQTRKNAEKFRDAQEERLSPQQVTAAQKRTKELRA